MYKNIFCLLMMLTLSSCFLVHKDDVEQGNIITSDRVKQLHPGMTEMEVRNIMGNTVLLNIFSTNRIDYVYTLQKGHQNRITTRVSCIFEQGRLKEILVSHS